MTSRPSRRTMLVRTAAFGAALPMVAAVQSNAASAALQPCLDYVQSQKTTGFLIVRDRQVVVERNWPPPADDPQFQAFVHGSTAEGALLEDVASQQKSFVAMLMAIAVDKRLVDVAQPVSAYVGRGWSKASVDQEGRIRVVDVLNMSSGLNDRFGFVAPPSTVFSYNTPVYAITKRILVSAAKQDLATITRQWLTDPAGMPDTSWRRRPATPAFVQAGNPTGLVTSLQDLARFGQIVLDGGKAVDGTRIVSEAGVRGMFERAPTNPSYGRLWWLNGGAFSVRDGKRVDGQLIPAGPADLVMAYGALNRRLYIAPSRKLLVVRMGAATPDPNFDQNLWELLDGATA